MTCLCQKGCRVVTSPRDRKLRIDAERNIQQILATARSAFAVDGPDVPLDEIARRAGVGLRTLHRHFPQKDDLVRAALRQAVAEGLTPAIERAASNVDTLAGLTELMAAAMQLAARERNALDAASTRGSLAVEVAPDYFVAMSDLFARAQRDRVIRADITAEDLPRIMVMLASVAMRTPPGSDTWRRYLTLLLDALTTDSAATPLPPVQPLAHDRALTVPRESRGGSQASLRPMMSWIPASTVT